MNAEGSDGLTPYASAGRCNCAERKDGSSFRPRRYLQSAVARLQASRIRDEEYEKQLEFEKLTIAKAKEEEEAARKETKRAALRQEIKNRFAAKEHRLKSRDAEKKGFDEVGDQARPSSSRTEISQRQTQNQKQRKDIIKDQKVMRAERMTDSNSSEAFAGSFLSGKEKRKCSVDGSAADNSLGWIRAREQQQTALQSAVHAQVKKKAEKRLKEIAEWENSQVQQGMPFAGAGFKLDANSSTKDDVRLRDKIRERQQMEYAQRSREHCATLDDRGTKSTGRKLAEMENWLKMQEEGEAEERRQETIRMSAVPFTDTLTRRSLIEQQNRDYEETLTIDRARREAVEFEKRRRSEEENFRKAKVETFMKKMTSAAEYVKPEPAADEADLLAVRILFPGGKVETRRFRYSDTVGTLLTYVEAMGFTTPDYAVFTCAPRNNVAKQFNIHGTFRDQNWGPRERVVVEANCEDRFR